MGEKRQKEIRLAEMRALPQDDCQQDKIVEGYAIVFERPTVLWTDPDTGKEYKEVISRGALDGVDLSDVPFKYNHSDCFVNIMDHKRRCYYIGISIYPWDKGARVGYRF